jgi:thiol-disulfide isomerase/thioredoxin
MILSNIDPIKNPFYLIMEEDLDISNSEIIRLKDTQEAQRMLTSQGPAMVIVYAKWCPHCQMMYETWKDLSNKTNGKAKIYVIEASNYKAKDVSGYPDMRIVKKGKSNKYDGGRSVEEMQKVLLGGSFGGKRSRRNRTVRLGGRVGKRPHRTLRRNVTLI